MPGAVDAFLKVSLAVTLLAAAGSVGYYYAIYLPARDQQVAQTDRADCLAKGMVKATFDMIHPVADPSPSCALPGGKVLNDRLQQSRERCLQESRLGLQ
jgi:hypothetical protein